MKIKFKNLLFAMACLTIACNNSGNQEVEQQQAFDAVMLVHDEVMPRIADVNRLTTDLRSRAEGLDSTQQATKNQLYDAIQALERADEGMMNWMAEVQTPETLRGEGKTHAEIMRYLEEQQKQVNQVRDSIQLSLQRGEEMLQQTTAPAQDTSGQQ
ncbi:MAG: hypothetical protein ACK4TA_02585 [Saprospiraceae bacterium]